MKKKISITILLILLLVPINEACAQEKFHVSVNAGYTFPIGGGSDYSNLKGGKNLGLNFSYTFLQPIEIMVNVGYSYIPTTNYYSYWAIPYYQANRLFKESTVYSPSNVNPDFYQASFGIRVINPLAKIKPFLVVLTGLYFMSKDKTGYFSSGNAATQSVYEKFYGVGFGFILPLNTQLDLTIEGRYESTFTGSQSFFPSMFGVRYNF